MTSLSPNPLCQPLQVQEPQPIAWKKELLPGYTVCLRPVSLHDGTDLKAVHSWLLKGYTAPLPIDQLKVFFILLGECSYAQAFMVLLNDDVPVGQFEVYQARQDELNDIFEVTEGDYRIYLPVIPLIASHPDLTIRIIQSCLQYIFSFPEVKRLFWVVPAHDKERNRIAWKTGFQLLPSFFDVAIDGGTPANIYQYFNESVRHVAGTLLK
jgi:hypothetical protein